MQKIASVQLRDIKIIKSVQILRRAINAPNTHRLLRAGATFIDGELVERPEQHPPPTPSDLDPQVLTTLVRARDGAAPDSGRQDCRPDMD